MWFSNPLKQVHLFDHINSEDAVYSPEKEKVQTQGPKINVRVNQKSKGFS